jgi:peptidyl-prolyl cis-trans isomerase SurA
MKFIKVERFKIISLSFVASFALALSICIATTNSVQAQSTQGFNQNKIVAVINNNLITYRELDYTTKLFEERFKKQKIPLNLDRLEFMREVLDRLITDKLQMQRARDLGIGLNDEELAVVIEAIAKDKGINLAELKKNLAESGDSYKQFSEEIRSTVTFSRLRGKEIEPQVRVSDAEIDIYLTNLMQNISGNMQNGQFVIPKTKVRHILLRVLDNEGEAQVKQRLILMRERILKGENFATLASLYSQDNSNAKGGELGLVSQGEMVIEFEQAMNQLQLNEVSQPVKTTYGYHLIQVLQRSQQILDLNAKREAAREILQERKIENLYQDWLRDLRNKAFIEIRI